MEHTLRASLVAIAVAFANAENCALSTVSRRCRNDSAFFRRISDVDKSFTLRTFDEVMQWFSDNWPHGQEWPEEIDRPAPSEPTSPLSRNAPDHIAASSVHPTPESSHRDRGFSDRASSTSAPEPERAA